FLLFMLFLFFYFFFRYSATSEIYTLSLHDALPIYDLRARPVLASLLRLRSRLPSGPGGLFRNLHSTSLGRVRLVLLGPGPLLFVPDGSGPRPGYDAELSPRVPEPERAALPVVLAPRRTARRAALRRSLELGHVRLAAEHGSLRLPGGLPDVRLGEGSVRAKGGPHQRLPPRNQRREPATECGDRRGPRHLHPLLR